MNVLIKHFANPKSALFSLICLFGLVAQAQQVSLSTLPDRICLKNSTSTSITINNLPSGVTVDSVFIDYNSDSIPEIKLAGPATFFGNLYTYTAPGTYQITAKVKLSTGALINQTYSCKVHIPPTATFTLLNTNRQCFKNNQFIFKSTTTPGDHQIVKEIWVWGDSKTEMNLMPGQNLTHSYTSSAKFRITLRVTDSLGCESEVQSLPNSPNEVTVLNNISPKFNVFGATKCYSSIWLLDNTTTNTPFNQVKSYVWNFDDGSQLAAAAPWNLPTDLKNFDSVSHTYTTTGVFYPSLIIEDTTGCRDTFRLNHLSPLVPQNVRPVFNIITTVNKEDSIHKKDSMCYTNNGTTIYFKQTPIGFGGHANPLWDFGDPESAHLNRNGVSWWPSHTYNKPGKYVVKLFIGAPCDTFATDTFEILGPTSRIENVSQQIIIDPNQKNQCNINQAIEFPNTSILYKSSRTFRLWDFGDDVAPRCTSFLVPNNGWPQQGGWRYLASPPFQQLNNSTGYWKMNGKTYPGKRLDCNYSLDTLPAHRYTDWDVIYSWYKNGHDFMPWDPAKYTRNPADTLPSASPKKIWVAPADTLYWGKPVYLNPTTGAFSLVQGSWTDPFSGLTQPWPRIDTIKNVNGPVDLLPYQKIQIKRGTPDPFALEQGEYHMFPTQLWVDPISQPGGLTYQSPKTGKTYNYPYQKTLPRQGADKTLYRYIFDREVQKCLTVKLMHHDSANHASGNSSGVTDFLVLDSLDCNHETTLQLALTKPDARGLGKSGKECPGSFNQGGSGIRFHFEAISSSLGDYPGVNPNCGQTFILLNHDSLADRMDNTPCVLDGFIDWQGGTTAGGLFRPIFSNVADWSSPMQFWNAPTGSSSWYHYGPGTVFGGSVLAPADPDGDVTVGLVVGSGNLPNACISDTIWYHNFFNFKPLNAQFFIDPVIGANGLENGTCKLYKPTDEITFVYKDSLQKRIKYSAITWGDDDVTIDSFWYSPGTNNGNFVHGVRRVRYDLSYGNCKGSQFSIKKTTPFPNGLPGVNVDTIWREDYRHRLYDPASNPTGTLYIVGPNSTNDSLRVIECGVNYTIAYVDTLKRWYKAEYRDRALMLLPVKHKFSSSSWENGCSSPSAAPNTILHVMENISGCQQLEIENKLIVRGVIDTFWATNAQKELQVEFCMNTPVHFMDSVRYWRPDCSLSDVIFNPNQQWGSNGVPLGPLNAPWNTLHIDTADYWRRASGNPNDKWPNGSFVEKLKWYFGDGDSAEGSRPSHQYKQAGTYTVKLLSRDYTGNWDTASYSVSITNNNIVITRPNPLHVCYSDTLVVLPTFIQANGNVSWSYPKQPGIVVFNSQNQPCIRPNLLAVKPTLSNPLQVWVQARFYNGSCLIIDSALVNVYALPVIDSIAGTKTGLIVNNTYTYSVPQQLGATYQWLVTNGNMVSGQGTHTVDVQWISIGQGHLSVAITNQQGCKESDSLTLTIGTSSIAEINEHTSLVVYPNPANHQITVKDHQQNLMGTTIIILDLVGRKVKEQRIQDYTYQTTINIEDLAAGTYHMQIIGMDKLANFKLVKN